MIFGIVIFPSKKIQDLANSYRKRYDSHFALIPPHIKLCSIFHAKEDEINVISAKIKKITKKFHPLSIKIIKISSFKPINNVIYLKVVPTVELNKLNNELQKNIQNILPENTYVPHITIGQNLSNDEHSDIYGALRLSKMDHEEVVDHIYLIQQQDDGGWVIYETFELGKE